MSSTPDPKPTKDVLVARADEQLSHAYEQIARADEQLARVTEQLAKMERDGTGAAPAASAPEPAPERPAPRGLIGIGLQSHHDNQSRRGASVTLERAPVDSGRLRTPQTTPQRGSHHT